MVVTKKQLENLRPAKKGDVRNPRGGKAHNPLVKAIKNLTIDSYREVVEIIMTENLEAIQNIIKDPNSPAFKVGIATSLIKAIKNGDYQVIERIAERIIGKIPETLNVNTNYHTNIVKWLDERNAENIDEFED